MKLGVWSPWRLIRLVAGIGILLASWLMKDLWLALAGGFLVVHAYINSCAACNVADRSLTNQKRNHNG